LLPAVGATPLFVAFSDEFKGSVLLRLLCSLALSPFFLRLFLISKSKVLGGESFLFYSLPKALIHKRGATAESS
jgi:hypothetical protein